MNKSIYETKWASPHDFPSLMKLLLRTFTIDKPDHPPFPQLMPDIYQPDNRAADNLVTYHNGQPIACVGLFSTNAYLADACTSIAGIGGVCTHPDYRGQNLMQNLLDQINQAAYQRGYSIGYLSGDRRRYRPWGYETTPITRQLTLSPRGFGLNNIDTDPWEIFTPNWDQVDWSLIAAQLDDIPYFPIGQMPTLAQKYQRLYRGKKQVIAAVKNAQSGHILVNQDGSAIHLWAGNPNAVAAAAASYLNQHQTSPTVLLPLFDDPYTRLFDTLSTSTAITAQSHSIINLHNFMQQTNATLSKNVHQYRLQGNLNLTMPPYRGVPQQTVNLTADSQSLTVTPTPDPNAPALTLTSHQLVHLFFDPNARTTFTPQLPTDLHWLCLLGPLPFYLPTLNKV